uniref:cytochrome P450 71A25-like isoform X1 n=1 Tax=Fragaria vesca subsp. vesca TaxID=101020 RepID=UPI0005C8BD77|nr:PREDICTED: cytochrome P450 71A25-like isoform X1 [Fragaria vesca subsp. vesca]
MNTSYINRSRVMKKMANLLPMLELKLNETFSPVLLQPFSLRYLLPLAIFLILFYRWSSSHTKSPSAPPSPPKLPVIGNLHQIGLLAHRSLQALAQRYGPDLMLLHFGSRPVVIVTSTNAVSQIFKTHDLAFSDRPKLILFEKLAYNYRDIVGAPYGEYWRQVKSICVVNLLSYKRVRSFGSVRLEETKLMMSNIEQSCSTETISSSSSSSSSSVLDLSEMFTKLTNDVICRVALGRKYSDRAEGRGRMFMELSTELSQMFTRVNIGDYIPWLAWFTRVNGLDAKLDDLAKRVDGFMDMVIQEHMDKSNNGNDDDDDHEDEKDFVDVLLSIQKENALGYRIDRISIKAIILDMFVGGTDTISTTLEWAMSELLRNPETMKKLQNEVRGIVGNKKNVTEEDLVGMHYLKAVTKETFRLHPPGPLLLPRMCNKDVKIKGYTIKANTQVMINAWALGRDPASYTNPEQFKPERFLSSTIDYKGSNFELIPFGAGRRGCPGIQFAMVLEELALANIVHKFDWALPHRANKVDFDMTEASGSITRRKYPLKAIATLFEGNYEKTRDSSS